MGKNLNVDVSMDLTNSIDKTRDELLKPTSTHLGNGFGIFAQTFETFIDNRCYKYIANSKHKKQQFLKQLEEKYNEIPKEKLISSNPKVLISCLEKIALNFDEGDLRYAFSKLLLADMNIDTKSKVHPAYMDVINQLSAEDAIVLKSLYKIRLESIFFPLVYISAADNKMNRYCYIKTKLFAFNLPNYTYREEDSSASINNLDRLGLIAIDLAQSITPEDSYLPIINLINDKYEKRINAWSKQMNKEMHIEFSRCNFALTDFGMHLIDICFNED